MVKKKKEQSRRDATEIIYGFHAIKELLKAKKRRLLLIYTTKPTPKAWRELEPFLPKGLQIQYVSRDVLHKLAGTTDHQSVVGYAQPFVFRKKFFEPSKQPCLVMLDGIQDPRNAGAILRTAYCTGADGIIMVQKGAAPLSASVLKSSAGLAEHMPIYRAPSSVVAIQELSRAGYTIYLSVLDEKSERATEVLYKLPLCLVVGNEATGISREILKAGPHVYIPQRAADISYNASVAAGILLFLVAAQKGIV